VTQSIGEIKVDRAEPLATITISRPDKLNSVTKQMLSSFSDNVGHLTNDPNITTIIFTGEGDKAFSAGFDLETIRNLRGQERTSFFKLLEKATRLIRQAKSCFTIAAINGWAVGFGAMVAVACDFRFCSETAGFRFPEVDLSVFPGAGAASNLLHLVGPARAKDLLLTSRVVSAQEALQIGLADRVFPQTELMSKTMEFVTALSKKNKYIVLRSKMLIDAMTGKDVSDAADMEVDYEDEWLNEPQPKK
jgi:enoyl-CoA hydratase